MKYKPNFNDPRVLNRIRHAYGFTKAVMSVDKPSRWGTRTIDKYYGRCNNQLGRYLRNTLLICTNNNYSKDNGTTKEYKINPNGLDFIRNILLGIEDNYPTTLSPSVQQVGGKVYVDSVCDLFDEQVVNEYCKREFGLQLRTLEFTYTDKSNRLWNPIQSVKKIYKKPLLACHGLIYQYDIETCAPTLIHQYSIKCGNDLYTPALLDYINNKHSIRERIANELEVSTDIVKVIINALFCGARIGNSKEFAISQLLNNDKARITWLKEDQYIIDLRSDIKTCWSYIEPNTTIRYKNNKKLPMSSKQKWSVYFQLERCILDSISKYLQQTNNKYFLEHDGFSTTDMVNTNTLQEYIHMDTGYMLNFQLELNHVIPPHSIP